MSDPTGPEIPGLDPVRLLGEGGQAFVFQYAQRMPRRQVAVKVLRDRFSPTIRDQFIREANTMASLEHPHIVPVYFAGVTGDQRPYLVMQYYPNGSLADRLRGDRFRLQEVLRVGIQIGSALETAHAAGVLHGDLKPHNILSNQYGSPGLSDFGIATQRASGGPAASVSLPWAPPEAIHPDGRVDVRSDVYSFAATLYHLLAGSSPFARLPGVTDEQAMMRAIMEAPVPPTGRVDAPRSLESLLQQGLAKDPALRPQSMYDLVRALQGIERELHFAPTDAVMDLAQAPPDAPAPVSALESTVLRPHADHVGSTGWAAPQLTGLQGGWTPQPTGSGPRPPASQPGRTSPSAPPSASPSAPLSVSGGGSVTVAPGATPGAATQQRRSSRRLAFGLVAALTLVALLAVVLPRILGTGTVLKQPVLTEVGTIASKDWVGEVVQSPGGDLIYVSLPAVGRVAIYDATSRAQVGQVKLAEPGSSPLSNNLMVRSADGRRLYVALEHTKTLYGIDTDTRLVVTTATLAAVPTAITLDERSGRMLVVSADPGTLDVIDVASGRTTAHLLVGKSNAAVAYDATTGLAYLADLTHSKLTSVNLASGAVARVVDVKGLLGCLVIDPAEQKAYLGDQANAQLHVVDLRTMTLETSIALEAPVAAMSPDFARKTMWVTTKGSERLLAVDLPTRSIRDKAAIQESPYGLSFDSGSGRVVVGERYTGLRLFTTR